MTESFNNSIPVKVLGDWNKLVTGSTFGNIFQSPEWSEFLKGTKSIVPLTSFSEDEKVMKAIMMGMLQKETGLKSAFSSRIIINGGPVFDFSESNAEKNLEDVLNKFINEHASKAIYSEIRCLNDYSNFKHVFEKCGWIYKPHLNFRINCSSESIVRKNISESKLRQINKSIKTGAEIALAANSHEVSELYEILSQLYRTKIKTPLPEKSFFLGLFHSKLAVFPLIKFKGKIIGGIVCPVFGNKVIYEWYVCGEDGKYPGIYPSVLATWGGIEYALKNKIEYFDFMGAGKPGDDYGVREFKARFGGEQVEYGRYIYIAKPKLYSIGKLGVKILKKI